MNTNQTKKKICKYGNKCYRKNEDHLKNFDHEVSAAISDENTCPESNSSNESDSKVQMKNDDLKPSESSGSDSCQTVKTTGVMLEKYDLAEISGIIS